MANINITVQSLINAAQYDSYTVANTTTVANLKNTIQSTTSCSVDWFDLVFNEQVLDTSKTLAYYSITNSSSLRTHNKISRLSTLELRQKSKLDLSALDRADLDNPRSTYDITELPTQYVGNTIFDNPNTGGLTEGRPWIDTVEFTFYEAINTIVALTTTQYVSGNKIYAYSSSYDVPSFKNARVVVNDIEVLNVNSRGHNMVVLDTYGDVVSTANYDTYGSGAALTALANALNAVTSGNIVVLVVYDASALNSTVRAALTNSYGDTNNNTWSAGRVDQIFIGIRI